MSLRIEKLEDINDIDLTKLKSQDKSKLLTRLKNLINLSDKVEAKTTEEAEANMPYTAVSVVGNSLVRVKFDLESSQARVVSVTKGEYDHNAVTIVEAMNTVKKLGQEQK